MDRSKSADCGSTIFCHLCSRRRRRRDATVIRIRPRSGGMCDGEELVHLAVSAEIYLMG